jgi:hypothetical protein
MSFYYATIDAAHRAKPVTSCGRKADGITTTAMSWSGDIQTRFWHSDGIGKFDVWMRPHDGVGDGKMLMTGIVGDADSVVHY